MSMVSYAIVTGSTPVPATILLIKRGKYMNLMWMFYWIDTSSNIADFLMVISIAGIIFIFIGLFIYLACSEDFEDLTRQRFFNFFKIGVPLFLIIMLISLFIPSKETSYKMVAASAAQTVYSSPEAKEVGVKLLSLINKKLDELTKEDSKTGKK